MKKTWDLFQQIKTKSTKQKPYEMWVGSQGVTLKSIKPPIQKKMGINNNAPNQDLYFYREIHIIFP